MNVLSKTLGSLLLCLILSGASPLLAAADDTVSCAYLDQRVSGAPEKALNILNALYSVGCLGGESDDWELARKVKPTLQTVPKEVDLEKIRRTITDELTAINGSLEQEASIENSNKKVLSEALLKAIDNFKGEVPGSNGPHKPTYWEYSPADGKAYVGIDVNPELAACKERDRAAACARGYLEAKQLVRYVTVTKRALDYVSAIPIEEMAREVAKLNVRWGHYFNDARSQFFWELGINGWIYGATNRGKEGLLSPPDYQVIVLHPSVGLEYVDTKPGDRFREAIVLEGLGINKWSWSDGRMKLPLGVSLIGVYGDRSSVPELGYGALFHYNNNLSLGVTRRGGHTGVVLSLDLAKLFLKQGADQQYQFKYRVP
jgi:hypothetical protein